MVQCSRCGALIPAGERYCKNCVAEKKPGLLSRLFKSLFGESSIKFTTSRSSFNINIESKRETDGNTGMTIGNTQRIEYTDETGKTRQVSSMAELPPHIRALVEKARAK